MEEQADYIFKIEGFTPQTMPFGRLIEYYAELRKLVRAESLRLINVEKSSHGSAFRVVREFQDDVISDLSTIADGTAPKTRLRAAQTINQMLREDGTSAKFLTKNGAEIIIFPGMTAPVVLRTKAKAKFTGELYHISASPKADFGRARIDTAAYGVVFCKTSLAMAKALREVLFEDVKVQGRGIWERSTFGDWSISAFEMDDFTPAKRETVRGALQGVRDIGIDWPADALEQMMGLREDEAT